MSFAFLFSFVCVFLSDIALYGETAGPAKPVFSTSFQTVIEANFLEVNKTLEFVEYFDFTGNKGALIEVEPTASKEHAIYDYNDNELVVFYPWQTGIRKCDVYDLSKTKNNFIFGVEIDGGKDHIFSARGALHFNTDTLKEVYIGKEVVRGILSDRWDSSFTWKLLNSKVNVSWYFSSLDEWTSALGVPQVPVRARVKGYVYNNNKTDEVLRYFDHYYEFMQWRPFIEEEVLKADDNVFSTPSGLYCAGRKKSHDLPKPSKAFSLSAEVVHPTIKARQQVHEFYDFLHKLVRYDHTPLPIDSLVFGANTLTEVHDFNTGIRYVMDLHVGNCTALPISTSEFDVDKGQHNFIQMKTPMEILNLNSNDFVYESQRLVRNIEADVWISNLTSINGKPANATVEWYFVKKTSGPSWDFEGPLKMIFSIQLVGGKIYPIIYNIFDYVPTRPDVWLFDVSPCYTKDHRQYFEMKLPALLHTVVISDEHLVEADIVKSIATFLDISPIRVTMPKLRIQDDNSIYVYFYLLDSPPIHGSTNTSSTQKDLATIKQQLYNGVKNGKFMIEFTVNGKKVKAIPQSVKHSNESGDEQKVKKDEAKSFSGGEMAALGVCMTLLGVLIGAGFLLAFNKFRGGSTQRRYGSRKTVSNPAYMD